jgi:hypothetical protein
MSQGALLLAGGVASCGAVLVLAGLSKLQRGVRGTGGGTDGGTAIRRVLRMPRRRWRHAEMAAGALECLTGTVVCAGLYPVAGGAAMATLGAVFCVLLGYARIKRVPGGCGCMNWRKGAAPEPVTWRAIARSALLLAAGAAAAVAGTSGANSAGASAFHRTWFGPGVPATAASAFHHAWFYAGVLAGALIFVLLSTRLLARTPVCHRRLWRPARAALRALAEHETFAAMAASAGPFGSMAAYRRDGCTEEFWLTPAAGPPAAAVMFRISYPAPDAPPAVHASLQDAPATAAGQPPRMISVPQALATAPSSH